MTRFLVTLIGLCLPAPTAAQVFLNINPAWSPDGRRIVFESRRGGDADLWILDLDSGGSRRVTQMPGEETHPSWSPDGNRIVFDALEDSTWNLWILDLRTEETEPLTHGPPARTNSPATRRGRRTAPRSPSTRIVTGIPRSTCSSLTAARPADSLPIRPGTPTPSGRLTAG